MQILWLEVYHFKPYDKVAKYISNNLVTVNNCTLRSYESWHLVRHISTRIVIAFGYVWQMCFFTHTVVAEDITKVFKPCHWASHGKVVVLVFPSPWQTFSYPNCCRLSWDEQEKKAAEVSLWLMYCWRSSSPKCILLWLFHL